ncbi:PIN domain-containing protein [Haloarcula sp. H-GB5]
MPGEVPHGRRRRPTGGRNDPLFAEFVDPDEAITAVEADPDDDKFLEAAVAGNVDYIVSGDRHLLDLDSFRGIDIVEPRAFYERLTTQ